MTLLIERCGRNKLSWSVETRDDADADTVAAHVYKSVLNKRALMSRDVWVSYDAEKGTGTIFAGMHLVGCFRRSSVEARP